MENREDNDKDSKSKLCTKNKITLKKKTFVKYLLLKELSLVYLGSEAITKCFSFQVESPNEFVCFQSFLKKFRYSLNDE